MPTTRPTKKQRELLSFINGFIVGHGYGPSYREIMRALNYKSVSTVATHIDNLIARGHLRKRDHSARSLELCQPSGPESSPAQQPVSEAQEKWLVSLIGTRFNDLEKRPAQPGETDQLYVLVGALHILGFSAAATAYKSRLKTLVDRSSS